MDRDANDVLQDQPLGSWRLKRLVDNEDEVVYKFSPKFVLKTGYSVTVSLGGGQECVCVCGTVGALPSNTRWCSAVSLQVWSADAGVSHSPPSDLLWKSQASWGTGNNVLTILLNADGEVHTPSLLFFCSNLHPN